MTSATSESTIAKGKAQLRADALTDRTVITTLMSDVNGRRWLWLALTRAGIFSEDSGLDAMYMAYQKGIRNEGLRLLRSITRYTPAHYLTMTRENTGVELKEEDHGGSHDDDSSDD